VVVASVMANWAELPVPVFQWAPVPASVSTPTNSPAPVQIATRGGGVARHFFGSLPVRSLCQQGGVVPKPSQQQRAAMHRRYGRHNGFARVTGSYMSSSVTVGRSHACALSFTGLLGAGGLVGASVHRASSTPTPIEGAHQFVRISAG
jgi:hypothetical protein